MSTPSLRESHHGAGSQQRDPVESKLAPERAVSSYPAPATLRSDGIPSHGSLASYVAGCPCDWCLTAKRRYEKQRRLDIERGIGPRLIDPTGTRRRIQALACLGWSQSHIATE